MPPKKSAGGPKPPPQDQIILPDGGDPALVAMAIVDKKKRNLEKRKNKLESLRDNLESGSSQLDKDQMAAVAKLDEVALQLELTKDLQKQFTTLQLEYQKSRKKQQKVERQAARESEREAERRAVVYTLRVQDILNNMGDEDKENFRAGSNGAVLLSEAELSQLDELYRLLTPTRQGNTSYQADLNTASELIQLVTEQSAKEVLGTTYKQLYKLLQRIDECGYFDRSSSDQEEDEESQEEGVADDEDYKSAEDNLTPANEADGLRGYGSTTPTTPSAGTTENTYLPLTNVMPSQQEPNPVVQPDMLIGYAQSAPSPTFPGLGPSPLQPTVDGGGFSFMHESEVDRGGIQAMQQPPTTLDNTQINSSPALLPTAVNPQRNYPQYPPQEDRLVGNDMQNLSIVTPDGNVILPPAPGSTTAPAEQSGTQCDLTTTDVATGQPNQSTGSYQGALGNTGSSIMNMAPPPSSYPYGGGALDSTSAYHNYGTARVGGQPSRGNRGGRNSRGGGPGPSGPKSAGGVYRNGRGMQGGYDMQTGPYGATRGYSGGGYQRGGRNTNYRGGPRK